MCEDMIGNQRTDMCICKSCNALQHTNDMYIAPNYVINNIYLGSDQSANDMDKMKELGITHIIVAARELKCRYPDDFKYVQIDIDDTMDENMLNIFKHMSEYINNVLSDTNNKILIHCAAGISRSPSIVIAYLMNNTNMKTFDSAFKFLHNIRPLIDPNPNFIKQLKIYEQMILSNDSKIVNNEKKDTTVNIFTKIISISKNGNTKTETIIDKAGFFHSKTSCRIHLPK
jgi:protein-tyrosine phosphatase